MSTADMLAGTGRSDKPRLPVPAPECQYGREMPPTPRRASPALPLVAGAALVACVPEPASTQELLQTITEVVDQGRAMRVEGAIVDLTTRIDPEAEVDEIAEAVAAEAAAAVPCAEVSALGSAGLSIDFGAPDTPCVHADIAFAGQLTVAFDRPGDGSLLATIDYEELVGDGSTLTGTTRVTWGPDATQRLVSELRLDSEAERQLEIQSDRIQRRYDGVVQIDGWHRWQTLMGTWLAEIGGWEVAPGGLLPGRGVANIDTPFEHDVYLDFRALDEGRFEIRANGGRVDRLYMIDPAAPEPIVDEG